MFNGIAIGGKKAAGKDMLLDHLYATRSNVSLVRCKTPIVVAYEKIVGHAYDKGRDDAELIHLSKTQIRANGNDNLVADYLREIVPHKIANQPNNLIVIPDMRRKPENDALFEDLGFLCIKVEASAEVREARIIARDGDLRNYKPDDDTEVEVDFQRYHYVISNESNDGGKSAALRLENILSAQADRFHRTGPADPDTLSGKLVRVVDQHSGWFWSEGFCTGVEMRMGVAAQYIVDFGPDSTHPTGRLERRFLSSDLKVV